MALLKQADLQSHGYKKEVTMKLVSEPGSDKPRYEKTYYIHKIVDCLRLQEVVQELQYLLPGKFVDSYFWRKLETYRDMQKEN